MARPRIIFFYLLVPAIFVIFVYSFIFARFSTLSHLHPVTVTATDALHTVVVDELVGAESGEPNRVPGNGTRLINTVDGYLQLDLNPNDTNFWSPALDQQYRRTLSQNQFPLKVITLKSIYFVYHRYSPILLAFLACTLPVGKLFLQQHMLQPMLLIAPCTAFPLDLITRHTLQWRHSSMFSISIHST